MVKRQGNYSVERKEEMRGGEGVVIVEALLTPEELYEMIDRGDMNDGKTMLALLLYRQRA